MSTTTTKVFPQYTPIELSRVNRFTRKKAAEPPAGAAAQLEVERAPVDPRAELIRQLLEKCDTDQDGRLIVGELRTFAVLTGFDASADEWAGEYSALCAERGADPVAGLDFKEFRAFLDDDSDTGQYSSDDELRDLVDNFDAKLKEAQRLTDASSEKQPPQQSKEALEDQPIALSVQTAQEEQLNEEQSQPVAVKKETNSTREPPASSSTTAPKEEARVVPDGPPPWLPLKKETAPSTIGDGKRSYQDRRKDLLKAALGQKPVTDVAGPAMKDLNGLSRGRLDGPDEGKGKGKKSGGG